MTQSLVESTSLAEAAVGGSAQSGRMTIQVITPGQGSSGYYSPKVCESAAGLIESGTKMYLDHPTEAEAFERPERSVRDLAAVFTGPGRWDAASQAVLAECQVFPTYRDVLAEMAPYIGVSIRGGGNIVEGQLPDGKRGRVVESISSISSVDFVTDAGRGGKVAEILESSRARLEEARNVGQHFESRMHQHFTNMADNLAAHGHLTRGERITLSGAVGDALDAFHQRVTTDAPHLYQRDPQHPAPAEHMTEAARLAEATANDTREMLDTALKDAYGGENTFVCSRDFDDTTVWYWLNTPSSDATYQDSYSVDDNGVVTFGGKPIEVRPVTKYVPVNPAGQSTTQESEEDTMPNIEEARLRELEEAHGRVTTLESERDTAVRERDEARGELAESRARTAATTRARSRVTEANSELATATVDRIVAEATRAVPTTEDGQLDEAALDTAVDEARTSEETYLAGLAEAAGVGRVNGNGITVTTTNNGEVTREQTGAAIAEAFGRSTSTTQTSQEG